MSGYKICSKCLVEKPLSSFGKKQSKCKECKREYNQSPEGKFVAYRYDAKRFGRQFKITKKEFFNLVQSPCRYCGETSEPIGLDRADNELGYLIENVVPCCKVCNFAKNTLSEKDFLKHISKIYLYQQQRKENGEQANPG